MISTETYNHDYGVAYQKGRSDALDEILKTIHNIYAFGLHCNEDFCEAEEIGYDCEDCMYLAIKKNIEHLKEGKDEVH